MNERVRITDWHEAHARLELGRKALQTDGKLPQEEVARILKSRALALATPPVGSAPATKMFQLLVFTLSGARFGIETAHVLEATSLRELIPVPCTPNFVVGVVNYRGRILTVLDFRKLFELAGQGVTEKSQIVVVTAGGMVLGIFIDAVEGVIQVPAHEVMPSPVTLSDDRRAFIMGVTGEMITILDIPALVQDPRFTVNEEVNERNS